MLLLLLGTGGWRGGSSRNGLPTRKKNPSHEKLLGKYVLAFSLLQEDSTTTCRVHPVYLRRQAALLLQKQQLYCTPLPFKLRD